MFNYLQNGNAILKPSIAIGPVKGPNYHLKFASFKCLAGKWLDSSNVLTVQGNWGSLERQPAFGEILMSMIDRDWCRWLSWWSAMITFHRLREKVKSNNQGWWTLLVYSRSCLGAKIGQEWTHGELVIIWFTTNLRLWQWLLSLVFVDIYVIIVILLMFARFRHMIDHLISDFDIDD